MCQGYSESWGVYVSFILSSIYFKQNSQSTEEWKVECMILLPQLLVCLRPQLCLAISMLLYVVISLYRHRHNTLSKLSL